MLEKTFLEKIEKKLKTDKASIEEALKGFATKDKRITDNWATRFPKFDSGHLEEAADEVEEYGALLPIEFNLENRLKDINFALDKIKKGVYGKCAKCGEDIPRERLEFYPEAKFCGLCKKRNSPNP